MSAVLTPPPRSRETDPDTSHAAEPTNEAASVMHRLVLGLFESRGPMTDSELNTEYALSSARNPDDYPHARFDTPRKRRSELASRRLVVDSGERRKTKWGRSEIVWRLPEKESP